MDERKIFNVGDIVRTEISGYIVKVTRGNNSRRSDFGGIVIGRDIFPSVQFDEGFNIGYDCSCWNPYVFSLYTKPKLKVKVL